MALGAGRCKNSTLRYRSATPVTRSLSCQEEVELQNAVLIIIRRVASVTSDKLSSRRDYGFWYCNCRVGVRFLMWSAQADADEPRLTLLVADNTTGYFGVYLTSPGKPKPYEAEVWRGGKKVHLGSFATAEEAALCVARTPEGQVAAGRAASADSQGTLPAVPSGAIPREKGMTPAIAPGAVVKVEDLLQLLDDDDLEAALPSGASLKEEDTAPPMPPGTFVKEEGTVPPMPPDACVKVEVVVKEEEGSDGRPHTQRQRVK